MTMTSEEQTSWAETPPLNPPLRHWSGQLVEGQRWLDKVADPVQNWIKSLDAPGMRKLKDILHGTWLGHPVHPLLTDVPIGSWTATTLLDAAWLLSENPATGDAADATLVLGLVGAVGSAVTGLADWSETDATDRRVGMAHGLLNSGALVANLISFALRRTGKRRTGVAVSFVGYGLTTLAAYLGGELSFAKGIGVNHVAWDGGSDDFVAVMEASDLPEKKLTRVDAEGIPAVLWKENQKIYALAAFSWHSQIRRIDPQTVYLPVTTRLPHGAVPLRHHFCYTLEIFYEILAELE